MTPETFWQEYVGDQSPEGFMLAFRCNDVAACVAAYVAERPNFCGIVRRITWHDTFAAEVQHTRELVAAGLTTYLEETRDRWEPAVESAASASHEPGAPEAAPAQQIDTAQADSGVASAPGQGEDTPQAADAPTPLPD